MFSLKQYDVNKFHRFSDYGHWSVCWICGEREQEYRLRQTPEEKYLRACTDCLNKEKK